MADVSALYRRAFLAELDELRADLAVMVNELPLGDVRMLIQSAADKLALAADLLGTPAVPLADKEQQQQ